MIYDWHANLKYKYGNRHFWARGYYVDMVGKNKKRNLWTRLRVARIRRHKKMPLKGWPEKEMHSANLSGPLKGLHPYQALLGPTQASGFAGGFDWMLSQRFDLR